MEKKVAGDRPILRRQPHHPHIATGNPSMEILLKPSPTRTYPSPSLTKTVSSTKENSEVTTLLPSLSTTFGDFLPPTETMSLAEELDAVRRRNEKLRLEKEKTDMTLRQRDLFLENGLREAGRRELDQREAELKLQHLLCFIRHRSLLRCVTISSLRDQEEKRRKKVLTGPNCYCEAKCEVEEAESSIAHGNVDSSLTTAPN